MDFFIILRLEGHGLSGHTLGLRGAGNAFVLTWGWVGATRCDKPGRLFLSFFISPFKMGGAGESVTEQNARTGMGAATDAS